ncbi:complex I subunit 5 family protein [Anoxynatronum sibiricum]|uniref:Complex I subunit 5 family protein n=1 Tax=Anoxynatronum sibiricum TaxID=210623 RepID=A0ABU9VPJ9_9CLOT
MNYIRLMVQMGLPLLVIVFMVIELMLPRIMPGREPRQVRRNAAKGFVLLNTIILAATYWDVMEEPIIYRLGGVFGQGMYFQINLLNYPFLVLAGILWLMVGYYSMEDIHYLFYTITYLATQGAFLAGDLLTFFLFFELMTLSSYALMVYHRGEEQLEAGFVYLYMGILGGLLLLSGILLLVAYTGTAEWVHLAAQFSEMGSIKYLIALFLLTGLGMKAGMVPFHFWMPRIYEKAPFAVVILSSAMLVKVGGYGMLRVMSVTFSAGAEDQAPFSAVLWQVSEQVGLMLLWAGIITMIAGALLALMQSNIKRMLAYSTISQMGYVIMGVGISAYLGYLGVYGVAGTLYHMINHLFFKALLIMTAGTLFFATDEVNLYRLGGLWKKMPVIAILTLIGLMGITGFPGLNGYVSKTLLHHGLVQAMDQGPASLRMAEWLYKAAGAGTVAYAIKYFYFVFVKSGEVPLVTQSVLLADGQVVGGPSRWMTHVMTCLAVIMVFAGLFPTFWVRHLMAPAAMWVSRVPALVEIQLTGLNFWNGKDLLGTIPVFAAGFLLFIVGRRFQLFALELPRWVSAEQVILHPVLSFCQRFSTFCVKRYESPLIFGDALIYAVTLFVMMVLLTVFQIWAR